MKSLKQYFWERESQSRNPSRTIISFLSITTVFLALVYHFRPSSGLRGDSLLDSYVMLMNSINSGGYLKFQEEKARLRNHISRILENPRNSDEENHAANIALYLFPEILPESNFEKSEAIKLWASLEIGIEKQPRTSEARMLFEEMKSNIWNYENPRISNVGLSLHAQETLKLYHELASP